MGDFEVEVFTKTLDREWLGAYETLVATPRHNQQPTAAITVPSDHARAGMLAEPGARVVIRYRGEFLSSAMVRAVEGSFGPAGSLTFQVQDDWRLLRRLLGWQVPGASVTAQGGREYATYSGPAESVFKQLVTENVARLGSALHLPVTVAPDQGRGAHVRVQTRMHPWADRLFPVLDQAGIGTSVQQVGSGLLVDCYEPQAWPIELSEEGGTITEGTWSRTPPEATRVVVQGPGEKKDRVYRLYVNDALEDEWGDEIEVAVDARDIALTDEDDPTYDFEALMAARGAEALAAGAVRAGLSLRLSETETFRYGGDGLHVGDQATVRLPTGAPLTDVVREATITDTADEGLTVTPVLGERADDDRALVAAVAQVARGVRDLRAGR